MTLDAPSPESLSTAHGRWGGRRLPWLLLISAVIIFLDRFTKTLVMARIPLGGAIPVLPGCFASPIGPTKERLSRCLPIPRRPTRSAGD